MSTNFSHTGLAEHGHNATRLISADKVQGTRVYNHGGDHLGAVDSIMIDKVSGEIEYVVMSFGGFLGIGEKYHPLPWDILSYDQSMGGYVVDLDRAALTDAPSYGRDDIDAYDYDRNANDIDKYYADTRRADTHLTAENRSDANDGVSRPLGYYSSQAQADRSSGVAGATPTDEAAKQPGFYSSEQQQARAAGAHGAGRVVGPEGSQVADQYEASTSGENVEHDVAGRNR